MLVVTSPFQLTCSYLYEMSLLQSLPSFASIMLVTRHGAGLICLLCVFHGRLQELHCHLA